MVVCDVTGTHDLCRQTMSMGQEQQFMPVAHGAVGASVETIFTPV